MRRHPAPSRFHVLAAAVLLVCSATTVAAQNGNGHSSRVAVTGKVIGIVFDRDSRAPLIGGQVVVEGTNLGNVTDDDGYYFLHFVPVGVHRVRADYLGYQTLSQELRILPDQTMTIDFAMAPDMVQAAEIVVVEEHDPIPLKPVARGYTTVSVLPTHVPDPLPPEECQPTVTVHGSYILEGEWQLQVSVGKLLCGDQLLECRPVVVHNPAVASVGTDRPE